MRRVDDALHLPPLRDYSPDEIKKTRADFAGLINVKTMTVAAMGSWEPNAGQHSDQVFDLVERKEVGISHG